MAKPRTQGQEVLDMLRRFRKELEVVLATLDAGSEPAKKNTTRPKVNA